MLTRHWLHRSWRTLWVLALGIGLALGVAPARGSAYAPADTFYLYLPHVERLTPLAGKVTLHGAPAAGVLLELRHYDGVSWNIRDTTLTSASGEYAFRAPTLNPGERYRVQYTNTGNLDRLSYWLTKQLTSFDAGVGATLATFDIANVPLLSPTPNAVLTLPVTFQWGVRPATPGDSYELRLYDPASFFLITVYPQGYVGSTTLFSPLYVDPGWFQWWIVVYPVVGEYGPLDAYGFSRYSQWVHLSEPALTAHQPTAQGIGPAAHLRLEWLDPTTEPLRLPPAWPEP